MANSQNNANTARQKLSTEGLAQQLKQLADQYNIKTWCLAYSGGVDSQVFLHLLHRINLNVRAVYIDHGLQEESKDWARHCEYQCNLLNIPFQVIKVDARRKKGESPESAARTARYAALKTLIEKDSCLLTAQHQDDQAETVLLQLLRGGGAAGLSAMPQINRFAKGWHCRPLLNISQQLILNYAEAHKLSWVEDPSNQQQNYDRNYLRHTIIPLLQQRWPALNKILSVFAEQQAENTTLLDELAGIDLQSSVQQDNSLNVTVLNKLSNTRLRNVLRYWVKINQKPAPSRAVLQQIILQMFKTSHDTHSLVNWGDAEVRRFRDGLYLLTKLNHDAAQVIKWDGLHPLKLPSINKTLKLINQVPAAEEFVLTRDIQSLPLSIRFRQGGERLKPAGRKDSHDLKSLFQESSVPAWQRDRIPLLYAGESLVAVIGYWLADEFAIKSAGLSPLLT